jgi:hypothetical protein
LIKTTRFDGCDEFSEGGVEGVEGLIHGCALLAQSCSLVPELHGSIIFETVFYGKRFPQHNQEKQDQKPTPTRLLNPPPNTASLTIPPPASGATLCPPEAGPR